MKFKTRKTTIGLIFASLFAPSALIHANVLDRISPFPSVPLNLQPKVTDKPKPNILVFLDNSYDGSRTADKNNSVPSPLALKDPATAAKTKLGVSKQVIEDLALKYPQYRWGVAAYAPVQLGTSLTQIPTCYESGSWLNVDQTGCTFGNFAGPRMANALNPASSLYFHDAGSIIYAPIETRTGNQLDKFNELVKNVPIWGQGAGTHSSPLTSAYYEMTRYYRGMRSAYQRAGNYTIKINGKETPTIAEGAFSPTVKVSQSDSAWRNFNGDVNNYYDEQQYVSPIQYRCQSNNIIMISSAADIRISSQEKIKQAFYEAYYSDPLFRHDNPKYAYLLDYSGSPTQQYQGSTYQVQDPSHYYRLIYQDSVSNLPGGSSAISGTRLYKIQAAVRNYYNRIYQDTETTYSNGFKLLPGSGYIRQVNHGTYSGFQIEDFRNVTGAYPKGPLQQYPLLTDKSILNPYMDVIEHLTMGKITSNNIKPYDSNTKFDLSYGIGNVITRNAYNEDTGLDAFAHLAYDGDVITKGSNYKYPVFMFPNGVNYNDAYVTNVQDPVYGNCLDKKCIYNNPNSDRASTLDDEGKPWDGSADKVLKSATGEEIDYSKRFGQQHINTYTIGFGITPPDIQYFKHYTITGFGVGKHIGDQTIFFDSVSGDPDVAEGDYVFYRGKALIGTDGQPYQTTTRLLTQFKDRYVWGHAFPYYACELPAANVIYGLDKHYSSSVFGDRKDDSNICEENNGNLYTLRQSNANVMPDVQIQFIPASIAQKIINPQPKADQLMEYAAGKGGGAYFSLNTSNYGSVEESRKALEKVMEHILNMIDGALVSLPVGNNISSNDISDVTSAVTTILDSDRWSSGLRFYKFDKDGKFDPTNYTTPHYITPTYTQSNYIKNRALTVINTPSGLRSLSVMGFTKANVPGTNTSQTVALVDDTENGVKLDNASFNIGADINHEPIGGLKIAVSTRPFEWKNLVAWLTRATDSDKNSAFKTNIFGVEKYIYRDRDPNNLTGRFPGRFYPREMGDVLDSNILLMSPLIGKDYQEQSVRPYLAVGANDGMLHIYKATPDLTKQDGFSLPYSPVFNYIPGAAKRNTDDDTLMKNLVYTAEQGYGLQANPHEYFVNGQNFYLKTFSGETRKLQTPNTNGQMMMTSTLGQGGRGAFALNIGGTIYGSTVDQHSASNILAGRPTGLDAPKSQWLSTVPLWDSSNLWNTNQLYGHNSDGAVVKNKKCEDFPQGAGRAECEMERDIGYTIGTAQVARVTVKQVKKIDPINQTATVTPTDARYAVFLASGFNSPSRAAVPTLYILDQLGRNVQKDHPHSGLDRKPGSLIRAIPVCTPPKITYGIAAGGDQNGPKGTVYVSSVTNSQDCISKNVALQSGLASPQGVDLDGDGSVDVVYAGDQNGNMWRFDLRGGVDKWTAHEIYRGLPNNPPDGPIQPITSAPAIYHNYGDNDAVVIFGTGSELYAADRDSKAVQALYGIYDHVNTCNPTSDDPTLHINDADHCRTAQLKDLTGQDFITQTTGKVKLDNKEQTETYRRVTMIPVPKINPSGWYLQLEYRGKDKGERVVYQPAILKNVRNSAAVYFTTHIFNDAPPSSKITCIPQPLGISSWVIALDAKNGGNLGPSAQLSFGGTADGKLIAGFMFPGRASPFFLPSLSNTAQDASGNIRSGVETREPPPKDTTNLCSDGKTVTGLTSFTGAPSGSTPLKTFKIHCGNSGYSIHRLSWRELF